LGVAVYPGQSRLIIVATYFPPGNTSDYLTNVVEMKDRMDNSSSSWGTKKLRTKLSFKGSERIV